MSFPVTCRNKNEMYVTISHRWGVSAGSLISSYHVCPSFHHLTPLAFCALLCLELSCKVWALFVLLIQVKNAPFTRRNDSSTQGIILVSVVTTLSLYDNFLVVFKFNFWISDTYPWLTTQNYEPAWLWQVSVPYFLPVASTLFPDLWNPGFSFLEICPVSFCKYKQIWADILIPLFFTRNVPPPWKAFLISRWRASSFLFTVWTPKPVCSGGTSLI